MKTKLVMIAVLTSLASPGVAAESTSEAPTDTAKKRCKTIYETGSFVKRRKVCQSEKDWRALEDATDRATNTLMDGALINARRPLPGGGI